MQISKSPIISGYVEDTKGVIRIRNPTDRQHNGQKKKDKQLSTKQYTDSYKSSNTNSTKFGGYLMRYGRVSSSCSTSGIRRVSQVTIPRKSYE